MAKRMFAFADEMVNKISSFLRTLAGGAVSTAIFEVSFEGGYGSFVWTDTPVATI